MNKAKGLFFEVDPEGVGEGSVDLLSSELNPPAPKTIEQIVQSSPGPNLDQIQVPKDTSTPAVAIGGKPDFAQIYTQAGVPIVPFGSNEVLEVIHSLPADLPIELKRKAVQSTLSAMGKAMGVGTESVVSDASRKLAALVSFADNINLRAEEFAMATEAKIAELESQIAAHKRTIEENKAMLASTIAECEAESDRIDDVLEFFTLDVHPSKNADPQKS